jgi:hypothetical protein
MGVFVLFRYALHNVAMRVLRILARFTIHFDRYLVNVEIMKTGKCKPKMLEYYV